MHTTYNDEKREALIRVSSTRLHVLEHIEAAYEKLPSIKLSQEASNAYRIGKRPALAGTAAVLSYCIWKYIWIHLEQRVLTNSSPHRRTIAISKGSIGKKILSTLVMGIAAPYIKNKLFGKDSHWTPIWLSEYIPNIDKIFFRWLGWEK